MIVIPLTDGTWLNVAQIVAVKGVDAQPDSPNRELLVWLSGCPDLDPKRAITLEGDDAEKVFSAVLMVHRSNFPKQSKLLRV